MPISGKKILLLAGDFVEDYEIMVPFQALQMVGHEIRAVCSEKEDSNRCKTVVHDFRSSQTYLGTRGYDFALNAMFADVDLADYDALVVPGGCAPGHLRGYDEVLDAVRHFFDEGKSVTAICHDPQILAAVGVLNGYEMTVYPAVHAEIERAGCSWVDEVTVDGNLVTGQTWPDHPEWLAAFLDVLGTEISHEPAAAVADD